MKMMRTRMIDVWQVPNDDQCPRRLPGGRHCLSSQQGRARRLWKTSHQVGFYPSVFQFYLHALVLILFNKIVESSELCLWFFDMITWQSSSNKITKYTKPSKLIHLSNWQFLVKKTFRHADGGFESVPMADTEENGHPAKWDNGVRILVTKTLHQNFKF